LKVASAQKVTSAMLGPVCAAKTGDMDVTGIHADRRPEFQQ